MFGCGGVPRGGEGGKRMQRKILSNMESMGRLVKLLSFMREGGQRQGQEMRIFSQVKTHNIFDIVKI